MKKFSKLAAMTGICLIAIWFIVPLGLTTYVNSKYGPDINVERINLSSFHGIDCVSLNNVKIKKSNISGHINYAIACYRNKSIDIDGGLLNITIKNSFGKESSEPNGLTINAKNLNVHLTKDNISFDAFLASINKNNICSGKVNISNPKIDAVLFNFCFDRKNNSVMASNGHVSTNIELLGHKVEDIYFTSLFKATKTELSVGEIKYADNVAYNIQAELINDFASIHVGNLSVSHKKLFSSPLSIYNINITNISKSNPLFSKINVSIDNKASVFVDIGKQQVSGKDACKNWFSIVPEELKIDPIKQMNVKGNFAFDVQFRKPISLKINSTCSIEGSSPAFITALNKPFQYIAYHPDGTKFERTSGPGTNDWIPLDFVDHMATALTITEDPGFWHHRGIIPQALENSLKDDIRLGKFFRGGSTITMQLAKNLWLNRSRTIGRKLQEGILTIALESCLSKEKILELYLNVVEFGPNTYGIGPGCAKFLKKYPGQISLSEALYMATRLPSPNKAHSYDSNKGFIKKLIAIGVASGKISEDELEHELQAEQPTEELED